MTTARDRLAGSLTFVDRFNARYGTHRGWVRLWLARVEHRLGLLPCVREVDWSRVSRVVFVCQGNVARSAFAEAIARGRGVRCASFGVATTTGMPADATAAAVAQDFGYALASHRTTAVEDFEPREGDLLLAMEPRQVRRLLARPSVSAASLSLLGAWGPDDMPHLHDPHSLSEAYHRVCFARIERAVVAVCDRLAAANAPAAGKER